MADFSNITNNNVATGTQIFATLFVLNKMLKEPGKELMPDSKFFEFCKQVTHSPASNKFWMRGKQFSFMVTVDRFLEKGEDLVPGAHICYGHNENDHGSFEVTATAGFAKFNPKRMAEKATKGELKYHEDDLEAFQECVSCLSDLQVKYDMKNK